MLISLFQSYSLLITGHSLGAGVAAILTALLQEIIPNVTCIAYSPPGLVR